MTELDVVELVIRLYDDKIGTDDSAWDFLCKVDGSYSALKRAGLTDVVIWRGSTTERDWIEDFDNFAIPSLDPVLGSCHPGFLAGVRAVQNEFDAKIRNGVIVTGHSLGAGHALIYAAHLISIGVVPSKVVVFGSPRPGCEKLADLLCAVPIYNYRNIDPRTRHHDLVTDLPFTILPAFPYRQVRQFIDVSALPSPNDDWGPFAYHHVALYWQALLARPTDRQAA